jgi:hypothetical protein
MRSSKKTSKSAANCTLNQNAQHIGRQPILKSRVGISYERKRRQTPKPNVGIDFCMNVGRGLCEIVGKISLERVGIREA